MWAPVEGSLPKLFDAHIMTSHILNTGKGATGFQPAQFGSFFGHILLFYDLNLFFCDRNSHAVPLAGMAFFLILQQPTHNSEETLDLDFGQHWRY